MPYYTNLYVVFSYLYNAKSKLSFVINFLGYLELHCLVSKYLDFFPDILLISDLFVMICEHTV